MKRLVLCINDATVPTLNSFPLVAEAQDAGAPHILRIPYAETPYNRDSIKGMQKLDKASAQAIVLFFNSAQAEKGICGYVGHPDYCAGSALAQEDFLRNEPEAYVWVKAVNATEDALELHVDWTPEGEKLVTDRKYRFFSPFFMCEDLGMVNSTHVYVPRILRSLGLTNNPNWKMPPIINSADQTQTKKGPPMKKFLKDLHGLINAGTVDETAIKAWYDKMIAENPDLQATLPSVEEIVAFMLEFSKPKAEAEASVAEVVNSKKVADGYLTQLKELRTKFATEAVNSAVVKGSLLVAHKETKLAEILGASDFDGSIACLNSLPPLMKTEEKAGNKASETAGKMADDRSKVQELVNSAKASGLDYDQAFAKVRKENPALFGE